MCWSFLAALVARPSPLVRSEREELGQPSPTEESARPGAGLREEHRSAGAFRRDRRRAASERAQATATAPELHSGPAASRLVRSARTADERLEALETQLAALTTELRGDRQAAAAQHEERRAWRRAADETLLSTATAVGAIAGQLDGLCAAVAGLREAVFDDRDFLADNFAELHGHLEDCAAPLTPLLDAHGEGASSSHESCQPRVATTGTAEGAISSSVSGPSGDADRNHAVRTVTGDRTPDSWSSLSDGTRALLDDGHVPQKKGNSQWLEDPQPRPIHEAGGRGGRGRRRRRGRGRNAASHRNTSPRSRE